MQYNEEFIKIRANKTFSRCWLPKKPKAFIIGVHGFLEHSGRYSHVGEELLKYGYALCMQDLRGHGNTNGERGYVSSFNEFIKDLETYIRYIKKKYLPKKTILFGHSMGGLIVLQYLAKINKGIDAAVTSGAAAIIPIGISQYAFLRIISSVDPKYRIKIPLDPDLLSHDEKIRERYISDKLVIKEPTVKLVYEMIKGSRNFWKYIKRIKRPIFLLHGGNDKIVPPKASKEAYKRISSKVKRLKIYPGLYHEILNEYSWRDILKDIVDWLNENFINAQAIY